MNIERVKKLKQQARELVWKEHRDADLYHQEFHDLVDQKFAVLIVCECMYVFSKDLPDPTSVEYNLGSLVEVTDRICKVVEHFGVEL